MSDRGRRRQLDALKRRDAADSRAQSTLWRELSRDQRWAVVAASRRLLERAQGDDPSAVHLSYPLALLASLREL